MRAALIAFAAALALGACSQQDQAEAEASMDKAAAEVKEAASDIRNDPDLREAGDAIQGAVADGGQALKEAGAELKAAAKDAGAEAKDAADRAGDETEEAAHDAAH